MNNNERMKEIITDCMTVVPWKSGQLLVWDAMCPDTFAPSHRGQEATGHAGGVASMAEERKAQKYACLDSTHLFTPVAIETAGVIGPLRSLVLLKDLGRRLRQDTREETVQAYMLQRLSIAVQPHICAGRVVIAHTVHSL